MAYGDLPLDAPLKPNKGLEEGACNRQSCQAEPASYYNHGMHKWYCRDCAYDIGEDYVNRSGWIFSEHYPGHPQFETREQMDAREAAKPPPKPTIDDQIDQIVGPYFGYMKRPGPPKSSSLKRMLGKAKRRRK